MHNQNQWTVGTYLQPRNSNRNGPSGGLKSFMVNLLIQISMFILGKKRLLVFFVGRWGGILLKLPGYKVKTQLLAEVIQGQTRPKLEMSVPDNNSDRRYIV